MKKIGDGFSEDEKRQFFDSFDRIIAMSAASTNVNRKNHGLMEDKETGQLWKRHIMKIRVSSVQNHQAAYVRLSVPAFCPTDQCSIQHVDVSTSAICQRLAGWRVPLGVCTTAHYHRVGFRLLVAMGGGPMLPLRWPKKRRGPSTLWAAASLQLVISAVLTAALLIGTDPCF